MTSKSPNAEVKIRIVKEKPAVTFFKFRMYKSIFDRATPKAGIIKDYKSKNIFQVKGKISEHDLFDLSGQKVLSIVENKKEKRFRFYDKEKREVMNIQFEFHLINGTCKLFMPGFFVLLCECNCLGKELSVFGDPFRGPFAIQSKDQIYVRANYLIIKGKHLVEFEVDISEDLPLLVAALNVVVCEVSCWFLV